MCSVCLGPHGRKCLEAVVAEGYLRGTVLRQCLLGSRGEKVKFKRMEDAGGKAKLRVEGKMRMAVAKRGNQWMKKRDIFMEGRA